MKPERDPHQNQIRLPQRDRRRCLRVPYKTNAKLYVIFPEETFTPQPLFGRIEDFSHKGARFTTAEAEDWLYRRMIQAQRYVKLTVAVPGSEDELILHGMVVWTHFDNQQQPPVCMFGIQFENVHPAHIERLKRAEEILLAQQQQPDQAEADFEI